MYHHSASRRGGRTGQRATTHSPAQPSSAAAKAAAAAKALHRRAQERTQEKPKHLQQQQLKDDHGCCNRIRNHPDPRNDVFRKSSLASGYHSSRGEGGASILKRLTAGSNKRVGREKSGEQASLVHCEADKESAFQDEAPKYLHHISSPGLAYTYPPSGMPGAYLIPPAPYGHPQPHLFLHHHGHSYLTAEDKKSDVDRVNHNADATSTNQPGDSKGYSKSNHHQPTTALAAPQYSAPRYFEGAFSDRIPGLAYPFSLHPNQHPPGHCAPHLGARNLPPKDCGENSEKKHVGRPHAADPVRTALKSPSSIVTKTTTGQSRSKPVTVQEGEETVIFSPPPPSRSTCRITGSHAPIHVPRAAMQEVEEEPLPYRHPLVREGGSGPGSVFRSFEKGTCIPSGKNPCANVEEDDLLCESTAHKILLSLSKSFDRFQEVKPFSEGTPMASCVKVGGERPRSPDEPPRIQHWHKQSSDAFEPQPSPLKLSYLKDADGTNIGLTSSFTIFNESFDMNLEGLLGPNVSFGFGPMRSLSFGLGLSASADHGDPFFVQKQNPGMSPQVMVNDGETREEESENPGYLQGLRVPSSLFGNAIMASNHECNDSNQSITVLIDARHTGSPSMDLGVNGEPQNCIAVNGSMEQASLHSNGRLPLSKDEDPGQDFQNIERCNKLHEQKIERSLFGAMQRHSAVFNTFSFLLPGAKTIFMEDRSLRASVKGKTQLTEREREVARRRVNSALCAFGGEAVAPPELEMWPEFKRRCITPKYKEPIPERYFEDENRLSWEIEDNPPIEVSDYDEDDAAVERPSGGKAGADDKSLCQSCGACQLRHDCPFKSSLQRTIGVMVYPAVNAFTATEPGMITPALSDMNNFVDRKKSLPESTPGKSHHDPSTIRTNSFPPMVSPDSVRAGSHTSLRSSVLANRKTPQRSVNYAGGAWISNQSPRKVSPGTKSDNSSNGLLFVDVQELRPEQYRIVARKKRKISSNRYLYPALPLPYVQRKRISNAMFEMSKSIPGLTDECASVLGEARRKDAWDFAVAQLMTQVIVVTHCSVEDGRLDGLSKYLLTLGIAC